MTVAVFLDKAVQGKLLESLLPNRHDDEDWLAIQRWTILPAAVEKGDLKTEDLALIARNLKLPTIVSKAREENDPFTLSIRLISLLRAISLIEAKNGCPAQIVTTLSSQLAVLRSEIRSSLELELGGNHVLFERFALWMIEALVVKNSLSDHRALKKEQVVLEVEFSRQFSTSGFHCEHSLFYHIQCLTLLRYYLACARALQLSVASSLPLLAGVATDHVLAIIGGMDRFPALSDTSHSLFGGSWRSDVRTAAQQDYARSRHNGAQALWRIHVIDGHYCVIANAIATLIVDIGTIGCESNPGHGHSDMLSVWCSVKDTPLLIDSGTPSYSDTKLAKQSKYATSHNTISVDGLDQAYLWSVYRWARLPEEPEVCVVRKEDHIDFQGVYRGFALRGGILHARQVQLFERKLIIRDRVEGPAIHDIALTYIVAPKWKLELFEKSVQIESPIQNVELKLSSAASFKITLEPWAVYEGYGEKECGTRVTILFEQIPKALECQSVFHYL